MDYSKWLFFFPHICFKQIPVRFKVYADFECNLFKKNQNHIPCSFAYKLAYVDDEFSKPIAVFRCENAAYEFIEAIPKEFEYWKKVMKKHFNKNLSMNGKKQEEQFQSRNTCWICEKLIDDDDEKVRDHCHITGKFRGTPHWTCKINLQLTKNVPVMFHNLRDNLKLVI